MNNDACDDATNRTVSLNNGNIPYSTVFDVVAPASTSGAASASTVVTDAHIFPSGQKQHTEPFYPVNMKDMENKATIYTTLES